MRTYLLIAALLVVGAACRSLPSVEVRAADICQPGCTAAEVIRATTFEEDPGATRWSFNCGLYAVGDIELEPGTEIQVVKRGPGTLLGELALVVYHDGQPHIGWVDENDIGNWSPYRPLPDIPNFCDSF